MPEIGGRAAGMGAAVVADGDDPSAVFHDPANLVRTEGFQDGYWIVTGLWSGNPESDFLLGLPSLAIHDQTFKGDLTGRRWKIFRPYVQDDWRVTKNLTLNVGVAWNLTTPISEVANR